MINIPNNTKRIFIIGNADEEVSLNSHITADDFIIRFNAANPSCKAKANLWFIANGAITVIRRLPLFTERIQPNAHIIFRYSLIDILLCTFEKISLSRRLRYLIYISSFKKKNLINNYQLSNFPALLLKECTESLKGNMPSSGYLMIYTIKKLYPDIPLYIHNFTFKGTIAHNWNLEEHTISKLINQNQIFTTDQLNQPLAKG